MSSITKTITLTYDPDEYTDDAGRIQASIQHKLERFDAVCETCDNRASLRDACDTCAGVGYTPTPLGGAILALVERHTLSQRITNYLDKAIVEMRRDEPTRSLDEVIEDIENEHEARDTSEDDDVIVIGESFDEVPIQDLTVIDGIGPKTQERLYGESIDNYKSLAHADVEHILSCVPAGVSEGDVRSWQIRAQELAEGESDE